MNRRLQWIVAAALIAVVAFGFVVIRTFVAKPPDQVKVRPIPAGDYDPAFGEIGRASRSARE